MHELEDRDPGVTGEEAIKRQRHGRRNFAGSRSLLPDHANRWHSNASFFVCPFPRRGLYFADGRLANTAVISSCRLVDDCIQCAWLPFMLIRVQFVIIR